MPNFLDNSLAALNRGYQLMYGSDGRLYQVPVSNQTYFGGQQAPATPTPSPTPAPQPTPTPSPTPVPPQRTPTYVGGIPLTYAAPVAQNPEVGQWDTNMGAVDPAAPVSPENTLASVNLLSPVKPAMATSVNLPAFTPLQQSGQDGQGGQGGQSGQNQNPLGSYLRNLFGGQPGGTGAFGTVGDFGTSAASAGAAGSLGSLDLGVGAPLGGTDISKDPAVGQPVGSPDEIYNPEGYYYPQPVQPAPPQYAGTGFASPSTTESGVVPIPASRTDAILNPVVARSESGAPSPTQRGFGAPPQQAPANVYVPPVTPTPAVTAVKPGTLTAEDYARLASGVAETPRQAMTNLKQPAANQPANVYIPPGGAAGEQPTFAYGAADPNAVYHPFAAAVAHAAARGHHLDPRTGLDPRFTATVPRAQYGPAPRAQLVQMPPSYAATGAQQTNAQNPSGGGFFNTVANIFRNALGVAFTHPEGGKIIQQPAKKSGGASTTGTARTGGVNTGGYDWYHSGGGMLQPMVVGAQTQHNAGVGAPLGGTDISKNPEVGQMAGVESALGAGSAGSELGGIISSFYKNVPNFAFSNPSVGQVNPAYFVPPQLSGNQGGVLPYTV